MAGRRRRNKTESAVETISRFNPDMRLENVQGHFSGKYSEGIASYDFVVEATDNFKSKFLVNDACVRLGKAFSHAGILGAYGQTMTFVPGEGPCLRCVFEDEPKAGTYETTSEAGVLGGVAGVIGTIQSIEAIKYLLDIGGLLTGRLLTFDALVMAFSEVKLPWDRKCAVCGALAEGPGSVNPK